MVSRVMNPAKSADTSAPVLTQLVMFNLRVGRTSYQYCALFWQVAATLCLRGEKFEVSTCAPRIITPAARYGWPAVTAQKV